MTDATPTPTPPRAGAAACAAVRELLVARALGALEATQEALVGEHLATCGACVAAEGEARSDLALVRDPAVKAPAGAWGRLQERLAAQKAGDDPVRAGPVVVAVSCSFCRGALVRANAVYCASCLAPHHPECWREHGRCSVMGCAETRVVRPTDTPDDAPQPGRLVPFDPRKAAALADERPGHRRGRRLGGLVAALVVGGGAVAALTPFEDVSHATPSLSPPPPAATTTTPPPAPAEPPRLDVDVREASLGALLAEIEKVAGVRVDVSPSLNDLLIRGGRWRDQRWDAVVAEVARELDLAVEPAGGARAPRALQLIPQGPPITERARNNLQTTSTMLVSRGPEETTRDLRAGPPHTVWASPDGQALALVEGRRATIVRRDGTLEGPFELPGRDAQVTWSKGPQADAAEPTFVLPAGAARRGPAGTAAGSWLWTPLPAPGAREARGGITALAACEGRSKEPVVRVTGPFVVTATRVLLLRSTSVVDLRLDPGPLGLVAACGPGKLARVAGEALELLEVDATTGATRRVWAVQAAIQAVDDPAHAEPPASLSAAGERLLLASANYAEVRRVADGARAGATLERKRQVNWSASLSPDGRRLAWTDGSAFVREADGDALLAGPFKLEHAEADVWAATWSTDGRALALFSRPLGAMGVVDLESSLGAKPRQVPIAYAVDGISDVRWLGASIAVQSVNATLRREHVRVCVAGAQPEIKIEVIDVGPTEASEPPPSTEAPPASEPAPPASEPAPPAPTEQAARPSLPPSVAHVRVGQRWRFEHTNGQVRTWDVLAVAPDLVTYRETITFNRALMGEPTDLTWAARRPEALVFAPGARRERQAIGGQLFDCAVVAVGEACTWTLVDGQRTVFPGEIRYERGGTLMWRLAEVEGSP